jgi:hypothetical protein
MLAGTIITLAELAVIRASPSNRKLLHDKRSDCMQVLTRSRLLKVLLHADTSQSTSHIVHQIRTVHIAQLHRTSHISKRQRNIHESLHPRGGDNGKQKQAVTKATGSAAAAQRYCAKRGNSQCGRACLYGERSHYSTFAWCSSVSCFFWQWRGGRGAGVTWAAALSAVCIGAIGDSVNSGAVRNQHSRARHEAR